MLHFGDQGGVASNHRFVAVNEGNLQHPSLGRHNMGLHADAVLRIVEPVGTDHIHVSIDPWTPTVGSVPTWR